MIVPKVGYIPPAHPYRIDDPNPATRKARQGPRIYAQVPVQRTPVRTARNPVKARVSMPVGRGDNQAVRLPLPRNDVSDAAQIIAYLKELSFQFAQNPVVRTAAVQVLNAHNVGQNEVRGAIYVLAEFVKAHMIYVRDPEDAEFVVSPVLLIRDIDQQGRAYGDCDDHVLLLASLLKGVGVKIKILGVSLNDPHRYDHVIVSAFNGMRWVDIDPCAKGPNQPSYTQRLEA